MIGATTGRFGAVWAQAETRKALASAGARIVDLDLPVGQAHDAFDADGALHSAEHRGRIDEILVSLATEVEANRALVAA